MTLHDKPIDIWAEESCGVLHKKALNESHLIGSGVHVLVQTSRKEFLAVKELNLVPFFA